MQSECKIKNIRQSNFPKSRSAPAMKGRTVKEFFYSAHKLPMVIENSMEKLQ